MKLKHAVLFHTIMNYFYYYLTSVSTSISFSLEDENVLEGLEETKFLFFLLYLLLWEQKSLLLSFNE